MTTPTIRPAVESDLAAINALYNREVLEGVATWELDEWPAERRAAWFHARDAEEPVLVAECDGRLGLSHPLPRSSRLPLHAREHRLR